MREADFLDQMTETENNLVREANQVVHPTMIGRAIKIPIIPILSSAIIFTMHTLLIAKDAEDDARGGPYARSMTRGDQFLALPEGAERTLELGRNVMEVYRGAIDAFQRHSGILMEKPVANQP